MSESVPDSRPNILLIFTDQQRADALGAVNPVLRTPVMDRLCEEGALFTQAHTPVPVCVPARCSLIFGQYATRTGCFENSFAMPEVSASRPTFMSALTDAGYRTHGVGKMHFTPDADALRGFQTRDTSEEMAGPDRDDYTAWLHGQGFDHIVDANGVRGEMYYVPQPAQMPARAHNSHWVADRSIDFLEHRDPDEPFLLWSSFIDPHPPFAPPVPWNRLYRGPEMPLPKRPDQMRNLWTFINRVQNRYKYRDAGIDDRLMQVMRAYYYATVSFIDYNVGRILETLEAQGELDNTLILWTADHGEFLGDYDCFGKRSFLASAANVPLIARYPARFEPGRRVGAPASLVDVMPTLLTAADVSTAGMALDGTDLSALASGAADREMVYGHYMRGDAESYHQASYMALSERWKYIYNAPENRELLFDLKVDPEETRNRAETIGYEAQTQAMRAALIDDLRRVGYTEVVDGDNWRVFPRPTFYDDPDAGLLVQDPAWAEDAMEIPGYTDER